MLNCLKISMTDGELEIMMRESDFNRDGLISYDEFLYLVKSK